MQKGVFSLQIYPYDRNAVVTYAHTWAYGRNPLFFDYGTLGGDCTNFASQCVYAGSRAMNFTPTYGWYYIDANNKAPAWTGVTYFYNFMTRDEESVGPVAVETSMDRMIPGDIIQLSFSEDTWDHTLVVVRVTGRSSTNIYLAAHSYDVDNRTLSTYQYREIRFLHFIGVRK